MRLVNNINFLTF